MTKCNYILVSLVLGLMLMVLAACSTTSALDADEQLYVGVKNITFSPGTTSEVQEEIEAVVECEPNGALFGSSRVRNPLQIGLWAYNKYHDAHSRFGKWMFRRFASEPVTIATVAPQTRVKVAENQLHNLGYFRGEASYTLVQQKHPQKAKISYDVTTGPLFRIDSVARLPFSPAIDSLLNTTQHQSLLQAGEPFSAARLSGERQRIERMLRNNGYYYFSASNITYQADTLLHPLHASVRMLPDTLGTPEALRPWRIGNIYITLHDQHALPLDSVERHRGVEYAFHGPKAPLKYALWRRAIGLRRGRPYRLQQHESTMERLAAMGVLSRINVDYLPSSVNESCDTLDMFVTATMDKLFESAFEMNATLKSNRMAGPGLSYELAKKNAFRGGEKVAWKIYGLYEWHIGGGDGGSLLNSYELGSELSVTFPRLLLLTQRRRRYTASTRLALDVDWKNRSGFFNMVKMSLNGTYNWHRSARTQHEFTVFDLAYDHMLSTTTAFDSITQANPALYVSMRDQFVPSFGYTYTHTSQNVRHPLWYQLHAKQAGNLVGGIYSALPGRSWSERGKTVWGSPFAQFVKLTAEAHKSWVLSKRLTLATRGFIGGVFTYGNSTAAPYSELFYAGGANSIRGFSARAIGPGGYKTPMRRYAYIDQMGDFKMEANLELRAQLVGNLHGAVFLDGGNVWLLHDDPLRPQSQLTLQNLRRMALGTGVGLRYDLTFLVLRVDFGIGLHAPYDSSRAGFYNIPRFRDGYALHFAIGYPF